MASGATDRLDVTAWMPATRTSWDAAGIAARTGTSAQDRFGAALDAARLGSWNFDPATRTLESDERSRAVLGFRPGAVSHRDVLGVIHPDDRRRVVDALAAATRPDGVGPASTSCRAPASRPPSGSSRSIS